MQISVKLGNLDVSDDWKLTIGDSNSQFSIPISQLTKSRRILMKSRREFVKTRRLFSIFCLPFFLT